MKKLISILLLLLVIISCNDPDNPDENNFGNIVIDFDHLVDQAPVNFDTLIYENEAGNPYLINEIQYFISDLTIYKSDGSEQLIDEWEDIHYIDTDIPSTHHWEVFDKIPVGTYDSTSFTFGISEEKNFSFMFVNPPERDMFWPEYLGGGYHYMKLNGKWKEEEQNTQLTPFDFHLGIGQIYQNKMDSIIGFIHNDFRVSIPGSSFTVESNKTTNIKLIMNIENWFKEPIIYDHNEWGGYIMQNQNAMAIVVKNGFNVFSTEIE